MKPKYYIDRHAGANGKVVNVVYKIDKNDDLYRYVDNLWVGIHADAPDELLKIRKLWLSWADEEISEEEAFLEMV